MLLEGKRIFLLEDDPVNFSVILTLLRREGAVTIHETWGDTTLRRLLAVGSDYDLMLLDLMLPGNKTGYDVYDAIRAVPELSQIPVVAVSASDPDIEIPKAKAKGFAGFISKPIHHYKFSQQLAAILSGETIWE